MVDMVDRGLRRVPQLDDDYATWSVLFKAYLRSKDLWDTLESPEPASAAQAEGLAKFKQKGNNALTEITLGVKAHHLPTEGEANTALDAWQGLDAAFTSKKNACKVQLTRKLAILQKEGAESLMVYLGMAKTLRAEVARAGHPVAEDTAVVA